MHHCVKVPQIPQIKILISENLLIRNYLSRIFSYQTSLRIGNVIYGALTILQIEWLKGTLTATNVISSVE